MLPRVVQRERPPFQIMGSNEAIPRHRLQPQPQPRRERGRRRIAPRPRHQRARRAQRMAEIVRRDTDAPLQPGQPSAARMRGASHGSGAGRPGHTPSFSPPSTIRSAVCNRASIGP